MTVLVTAIDGVRSSCIGVRSGVAACSSDSTGGSKNSAVADACAFVRPRISTASSSVFAGCTVGVKRVGVTVDVIAVVPLTACSATGRVKEGVSDEIDTGLAVGVLALFSWAIGRATALCVPLSDRAALWPE